MKSHPSIIKRIRLCNKIIESGLIFLVFFTAFSFGAVEVWAYSLMELVIFTLSLVWLIKVFLYNNSGSNNSHSRAGSDPNYIEGNLPKYPRHSSHFIFIPIALFVLLILIQLIPLPPKIIKFISPNTYELYALTLPGYDQEQTPSSVPVNGLKDNPGESLVNEQRFSHYHPLSINPYATKTILLQVLAYITIFFLVIHNFTFNKSGLRNSLHKINRISGIHPNQIDKRLIKCGYLIPSNRLVHIIIVTGFLVALLGIFQELTNTTKIFWILKMPITAKPFATFVNRNNFVGYINMIIPIALVILISQQSFLYKKNHYSRSKSAAIKRLIVLLDPWVRKNGLYLLAAITMISALILTGSRGGILSFYWSFGRILFCK